MIPLRWVCPTFDTSGYASATRSYLNALIDTGEVDLSVGTVSFEKQKTTHGGFADKVKPYMDKKIANKIQVVHLTPENYVNFRTQNTYNIGYTAWEADHLPHQWVELCNLMNEIWVPSTWNAEVFKASGVKPPIHVIPHIIRAPDISKATKVTLGVEDDTFIFYSIFQWIERKNPIGLLKAYLTEFKADENVCLALKSYRLNTSIKEQGLIKTEIGRVKKALAMPNSAYPPIRFFGSLLTSEQMMGFHDRGDCFVLPHKGEGFGIPHAEAMALGKPVIATNYSGNLEFMNSDNSYLVDCFEAPVCNMIFPNYHGYMNWVEPSVSHLKALMRQVYEDRKAAKKVGERAAKDISEQLSAEIIAGKIVGRLQQIQEKLNG